MVDSTNPRIMADNIRKLEGKILANDVEGNPSGTGYNTLLTKIKIDGKKFKLPNQVIANPTGEASDEIESIEVGGTIYSLGGGYVPNYSETEAEVGYKFGNDTVYGKLIPITGTSIGTSWTNVDSNLDASFIKQILEARVFFNYFSDHGPMLAPIGVYLDNTALKVRTNPAVSDIEGLNYLYIEYTKVASE